MPERGKKKKNWFLPQAVNDRSFVFLAGGRAWGPEREPAREAEPEPEEPAGLYPCPCCGCRTFPAPREEAMAYICPVCLWENDVFDPGEDDPSDENRGMTLRQGRENYRKWGAVREDLVPHARPPRPGENPDSRQREI